MVCFAGDLAATMRAAPTTHREFRPAVSQFVGRTKSAPMPALDADRDVDLAHHDGLAVSHVASVALDQVGAHVSAGSQPRGVVENAAVWGVGGFSRCDSRGVRGGV